MSRWCKDGRRRFLSFLDPLLMILSPGAPAGGRPWKIHRGERQLLCDLPCRYYLGLQCSGGHIHCYFTV